MQLSYKASTRTAAAASIRTARVAAPRVVSGGSSMRPMVVVRAESEGPDYGSKAQEYVEKTSKQLTETWESTSDAEKPAIIAIFMVVSIAQIGIAAVMDKVDKLPIFGDFFELIGVAVVAAYTYRYITDPAERASTKEAYGELVKKVTGK